MITLDRRNWLFAANSFAASMLALYIALRLALPRPSWAMMSAYVVSQPLAGALRSRALYRVAGTVVGAAVTLALLPRLVQAPELLAVALALWVAVCLYFAYLDRTPRSYLFSLAGFTAALIGFPSIHTPEAIFDTAVARVLEISIGMVCATVVHGVFFPRPVVQVIDERVGVFLRDAAAWAEDTLAGRHDEASRRDWRRLAGAVEELRVLATHIPFDNPRLRPTSAVVRALQERLSMLLPLLASVDDRLGAIRREAGTLDPALSALLDQVSAWIRAGAPLAEAQHVRKACEAAAPEIDARSPWIALLTSTLVERLGELVDAFRDCVLLRDTIRNPVGRVPPEVAELVRARTRRPLHRDHGMALLTGLTAVVAILGICTFWFATSWPEGGTSAMIAAVFTSLFATRDDPFPNIVTELLFNSLAFVVGGIYLFAVLPRITGFPMLVLVLAPVFLVSGALMSRPTYVGRATPFTMGLVITLAIEQKFQPNFAAFVNGSFAQWAGFAAAALSTFFLRSMRAETIAYRILRAGWRDLARITAPAARPDRARWMGLTLDRLGLLASRLAGTHPGEGRDAVDAVDELRVGLNVIDLQIGLREVPGGAGASGVQLLDGLSRYFRARSAGRVQRPDDALLAPLDRTLASVTALPQTPAAHGSVRALVGLRRVLFPDAPPYVAPEAGA